MEKQETAALQVRGKGSFWLNVKVLNALVSSATVTQICVYLILARYTDATGQYSTCGMTGVKKALGLGDEQARRVLAGLDTLSVMQIQGRKKVEHRLVYSAEEWATQTGEVIERPTLKSQVRFYLSPFGVEGQSEGRVWFANTLVDGYGRFSQPLKRLKRLGDVAARLLLTMYRENRMEQFGGVPPYVVNRRYISKKKSATSNGYQLWHATRDKTAVYQTTSLPTLRLTKFDEYEETRDKQIQPFWDALEALLATGLIYEVVTVFDAEAASRDTNVVYELDARSRHGYKPKGEEGLAGDTARLAGYLGHPVAIAGQFDGTYAAIIEQGVTPHIAGIFRLRFRVANPKNYTVSAAFHRIWTGQSEWHDVLAQLLERYQPEEAKSIADTVKNTPEDFPDFPF